MNGTIFSWSRQLTDDQSCSWSPKVVSCDWRPQKQDLIDSTATKVSLYRFWVHKYALRLIQRSWKAALIDSQATKPAYTDLEATIINFDWFGGHGNQRLWYEGHEKQLRLIRRPRKAACVDLEATKSRFDWFEGHINQRASTWRPRKAALINSEATEITPTDLRAISSPVIAELSSMDLKVTLTYLLIGLIWWPWPRILC